MRIIHTSDWHLGAQLHDQSRIPEQEKFLEWLKEQMILEKPDALIVAGDVFDTYAPPNAALNLYYDFLASVFKGGLCRTVVVIGGNHDSPSLLDATHSVLSYISTRVVGKVEIDGTSSPVYGREVVVVKDSDGAPGLVIGAVPYLRDSDLRTSAPQETDTERSEKLKRGFRKHYEEVFGLARGQSTMPDGRRLPIILTGHLFLTDGRVAEEKSERDLIVGNLGSLELELLPEADYYALGHLHIPQKVCGKKACRYSGSPIPMSFGESVQDKSIVVVEFFSGSEPSIRCVSIPQTQKLVQLKGSPESITADIHKLLVARESVWVDVQVAEGEGELGHFWKELRSLVDNSSVLILRELDVRPGKLVTSLAEFAKVERLKDITPERIFAMRLDRGHFTEEEKTKYNKMFREILCQLPEINVEKE